MRPERIAVWPDGTWCYEGDLEEYLTFMSNDYELRTDVPTT